MYSYPKYFEGSKDGRCRTYFPSKGESNAGRWFAFLVNRTSFLREWARYTYQKKQHRAHALARAITILAKFSERARSLWRASAQRKIHVLCQLIFREPAKRVDATAWFWTSSEPFKKSRFLTKVLLTRNSWHFEHPFKVGWLPWGAPRYAGEGQPFDL